jgi:hypothetical protein
MAVNVAEARNVGKYVGYTDGDGVIDEETLG